MHRGERASFQGDRALQERDFGLVAFLDSHIELRADDADRAGGGFNPERMRGILGHGEKGFALVELDEGPRIAAALSEVQATPEGVDLDMRVEVRFDRRGDFAVPYFVPEGEK